METQEANYKPKNDRLVNPNQLPNLCSWNLTFVMQEKLINGANYLVITSGGMEIWKEFAYWEYYESFLRIGKVLLEKYGKYMMDFIPDVKWINIYGDNISASDVIHNYRMEIREKYNKRIKDEERSENL